MDRSQTTPGADRPNQGAVDAPPTGAVALLEAEIARLTQHGYVIVSRSATSVQLRRPKHFSVGWALVWLVVGLGAGLAIYVAWYVLIKRDHVVFLRITPDGQVLRTSN